MKRSVALALLLAACTGSGEPSTDNLRDALAGASNRGAAKAEKLACTRSPERPGYNCDYRAPACNRFTGTCGAERTFTGRFLHAGGRWQLVEDLTRAAAPDPATQPLPGVVLATPSAPSTAPAPLASDTPPREPVEELSRQERRQIARWRDMDARCREGEETAACIERDATGAELRRRELCYGPPGAFGYDEAWRPCR